MIFSRKKASPKVPVLAPSAYIPEPDPSSKIVLVADDDKVVLAALSMKLRHSGYRVVTASDCSEAINAAREHRPDLMLIDVHFPPDVGGVAWTGFSVTEWLRRTDYARNVPVVLFSGDDRPDNRRRALDAGASAFLRKPIDGQELLISINQALSTSPKAVSPPPPLKMEPVIRSSAGNSKPASGQSGTALSVDSL